MFWPYKPVEMRTKIRTFSVPDHIGEIGHFGSIWANFPKKLTFGRKISVFLGFLVEIPNMSQLLNENRENFHCFG